MREWELKLFPQRDAGFRGNIRTPLSVKPRVPYPMPPSAPTDQEPVQQPIYKTAQTAEDAQSRDSQSRDNQSRDNQNQPTQHSGGDVGKGREMAGESQTSLVTPTAPGAPVSFIPHTASGAIPSRPLRIRTGRFGELEEHELVRLLDSIEDERARSRFRESIYISFFVWVAIAWVVFYGPRFLWHAPKLVLPSDVLRQRELTRLEAPRLPSGAPAPRSAPRPAAQPAPRLDQRTLDHLREPPPRPARTAAPESRPATPVLPPSARPNLPLPSAPQPQPSRPTPPVVADAPTPQPSSHSSFNTGGSAGENIQNAIQGAARNRGGGGATATGNPGGSSLGTGYDILSDTQGVNFDPYIRRILRQIYNQWIPLIPEEARPPLSKSGTTLIRFTILPDGNIGFIGLDGSTHDEALNRAAWGSITGVGQFPPLPPQFHGPNLELRIHYLVNKKEE